MADPPDDARAASVLMAAIHRLAFMCQSDQARTIECLTELFNLVLLEPEVLEAVFDVVERDLRNADCPALCRDVGLAHCGRHNIPALGCRGCHALFTDATEHEVHEKVCREASVHEEAFAWGFLGVRLDILVVIVRMAMDPLLRYAIVRWAEYHNKTIRAPMKTAKEFYMWACDAQAQLPPPLVQGHAGAELCFVFDSSLSLSDAASASPPTAPTRPPAAQNASAAVASPKIPSVDPDLTEDVTEAACDGAFAKDACGFAVVAEYAHRIPIPIMALEQDEDTEAMVSMATEQFDSAAVSTRQIVVECDEHAEMIDAESMLHNNSSAVWVRLEPNAFPPSFELAANDEERVSAEMDKLPSKNYLSADNNYNASELADCRRQ